jgi:hypothetical protein
VNLSLRGSRLLAAAGPSEAFGWLLASGKQKLLPEAKPKEPLTTSHTLLTKVTVSTMLVHIMIGFCLSPWAIQCIDC